jgi:ABC-type transporter MlaC component
MLLALNAFGAAEGPKDVVQEIFTKASAPAIASDKDKQAEVNALVDFAALARAALGGQQKAVSAREFDWFKNTLKEIITRTVYPEAPDFLKNVKITYSEVREKGPKATVRSSVQNKSDITDVDYELAREKGGGWKVVDISISGLSWVESINDQVKEVLKKKKWQGLKEAMNKRLAELKSGKSP